MSVYKFHAEQNFPISLQAAWDFFSSPANLSKITPPEMGFKVLTPIINKKVYSGMEIEYLVKPLFGIPLKWRTLIDEVKEQSHFTDKQLKGPYSLWEHTHTFIEKDGGVLMIDDIKYKLPFGFLGDIFHTLIVRKRVNAIFQYRRAVLNKLFN